MFFFRQLTSEVVHQYFSLVRSQRVSDYILKGAIVPFTHQPQTRTQRQATTNPVPPILMPPLSFIPGTREFFSWEINDDILFFDSAGEDISLANEPAPVIPVTPLVIDENQEFYFRLELIDNLTGTIIARQQFIYLGVDNNVRDMISVLVYNMLSGIPDIEITNYWRDNLFFVEGSLLWAPRIYTNNDPTMVVNQSVNLMNFGIRTSMELHFTNYMSFGTGFQLAQDWIMIGDDEYLDLLFELPLSLKFVLKPGEHYMLEMYGGIGYNFSLINRTIPSLSSWHLGFQIGVKAGSSGMIVIDSRFFSDLEESSLPGIDFNYMRRGLYIGVGYKYGFFLKRSMRDF
jgi:hypothetical protein